MSTGDDDTPNGLPDPDDATYKYSVDGSTPAQHNTAVSSEWAWRHEHNNPRITTHAQERWDERTPAASVSPETAWLYGVGVGDGVLDWFEDGAGDTPDEVRLYHGLTEGDAYSVVFLVCGGPAAHDDEYHVRTVYRVHDIEDPRMRLYLAAVEWQATCMYGGDPACDTPPEPVYDAEMVAAALLTVLPVGGAE